MSTVSLASPVVRRLGSHDRRSSGGLIWNHGAIAGSSIGRPANRGGTAKRTSDDETKKKTRKRRRGWDVYLTSNDREGTAKQTNDDKTKRKTRETAARSSPLSGVQ